ncbi:proline--tRNA ligase, partial [Candidatus Gottesmanbacteria bacterium]|nr:proline--tRNA ligase [Candidatus Gottesmanbacteria bacterium]
MRYSQLFGKTNKSAKQLASINATLLQKAGFVDQTMAGVYSFLPLGLRVLAKIENIIRQEMNKIASEAFLPSIVPLALWQQTGRLSTVDVLLKTVPANKHSAEKNAGEYILNSTHEEVITPIAQKFNGSYKDFPFAVYQIQSKFRNEPRAKSGLLRCREFRMKDLYSFHTSEEDLKRYYEIVKDTYWKVFQRLGLAQDTYLTMASGGDFSDDYSHEFQTICATGEDTIFHAEKAKSTFNREVAPSQAEKVVSREAMKPCEDVFGQGIIGVGELATFLKIPLGQTTKTLIFVTDGQDLVAAAVRGGYDVNEEKLKKVLGCKSIKLASSEQVKQATGAEVGYAGLINLPQTVKVIMDESLKGRVNFE